MNQHFAVNAVDKIFDRSIPSLSSLIHPSSRQLNEGCVRGRPRSGQIDLRAQSQLRHPNRPDSTSEVKPQPGREGGSRPNLTRPVVRHSYSVGCGSARIALTRRTRTTDGSGFDRDQRYDALLTRAPFLCRLPAECARAGERAAGRRAAGWLSGRRRRAN